MFTQNLFTMFVGQTILLLFSLKLFSSFTSFLGKFRLFSGKSHVKIGQKYLHIFCGHFVFLAIFFLFSWGIFFWLVIFGVEWDGPKPEYEKICVGDGFVSTLFVLFAPLYRVVTREILLQFAKKS